MKNPFSLSESHAHAVNALANGQLPTPELFYGLLATVDTVNSQFTAASTSPFFDSRGSATLPGSQPGPV